VEKQETSREVEPRPPSAHVHTHKHIISMTSFQQNLGLLVIPCFLLSS